MKTRGGIYLMNQSHPIITDHVAIGQCYFIKTSDFYTFNVMFSNIYVV